MPDYRGKKVLIIGAARQGLALARFLAKSGANVTLNDNRSLEELAASTGSLADLSVRFSFGGHPLTLLDSAELVCVSGGVPLTLPLIAEANRRNIPLTNDTEIFMRAVKAAVTGITGSAGKTTTTSLVGRIQSADHEKVGKVWVGGNIGLPLVEFVDQIKPQDRVILEISSFQLEQMTLSPHIAAVLNITPNHLDRHGTMAEYIRVKSKILAYQDPGDITILNRDDTESWNLLPQVKGFLISFGMQRPPAGMVGTFVEDGFVKLAESEQVLNLVSVADIVLRGQHNLMNVLAACAISYAGGVASESMREAVSGFTGVEHRLESVREHHGVKWINDSIATAPERTTAAITSFNEPIVLLLGGRDKNLPWDALAELIHRRVDHVVIFGEAGGKIAAAIGTPRTGDRLESVTQEVTLEGALMEAQRVAEPGDVVLLSPGCTSYDAYRDFEERGDYFREWVRQLP